MILFINTNQADILQVKLININTEKIIRAISSKKKFKQAEELLPFIDKVIKNDQIKAIAAVTGPGGFSSLRIGLVTANTLAWSLNIPLIAITALEAKADLSLISAIKKGIARVKNKKAIKFKPLVPKYTKEPDIS